MSCKSRLEPRPVAGSGTQVVSYTEYEQLLGKYLSSAGTVDYQRWKASPEDEAALGRFVDSLAKVPPQQASSSYETRLAYWMNLYNALVMREVLRRWPISSVRDVRVGTLTPWKNFFSGLRFQVGDREMSLDDIEHRVIREQYADARIHFALNCGARSCPPLRPIAFSAAELEETLSRATREFLQDSNNLSVDHREKKIVMSKLFDWYDDDFAQHAKRKGRGASVLDFIRLYADADVSRELDRALDYSIEYRKYDWSVNSGRATTCGIPAGTRIPNLSLRLAGGGTLAVEFPRPRPMVVDLWASYCRPCRDTLPALDRIRAEFEGVDVLAVSLDEGQEEVLKFLSEVPLGMDVAVAGPGFPLEPTSLPTLISIGPDGVVHQCLSGAPKESRVRSVFSHIVIPTM